MMRVLAAMRHNIKKMRKSTKVADESMFGEGNGVEFPVIAHHTRQGWNGLSLIYSIIRAPISLLSCLSSHPPHAAADGVWVSANQTNSSILGLLNSSLAEVRGSCNQAYNKRKDSRFQVAIIQQKPKSAKEQRQIVGESERKLPAWLFLMGEARRHFLASGAWGLGPETCGSSRFKKPVH